MFYFAELDSYDLAHGERRAQRLRMDGDLVGPNCPGKMFAASNNVFFVGGAYLFF